MTTTTLTSKGQITIPKELRERLNLKQVDKLVLLEEDGKVILRKVPLEEVRKEALKKYESGEASSHEKTFEDSQ